MKYFILNIGLNVGDSEPKKQLENTLGLIGLILGNYVGSIVKENTGGSDWDEERVLVCNGFVEDNVTLAQLEAKVRKLCALTYQDAIALKFDGVGSVVFNNYYEGERYTFNEDYFLNS